MKRLTAVVLCLGLVGVTTAGDDGKKALKDLEGDYTVKLLESRGKQDPEQQKRVLGVTIKDGVITIKLEKRSEPANIKLDPSKKPAHIDITPTRDGKGGKDVVQGIYKLEKGELTIVFTEGGDRPTEFKTEGTKAKMMVLVKKDAKK
jgi:uncharacterized protein (TIGR03067 family)